MEAACNDTYSTDALDIYYDNYLDPVTGACVTTRNTNLSNSNATQDTNDTECEDNMGNCIEGDPFDEDDACGHPGP